MPTIRKSQTPLDCPKSTKEELRQLEEQFDINEVYGFHPCGEDRIEYELTFNIGKTEFSAGVMLLQDDTIAFDLLHREGHEVIKLFGKRELELKTFTENQFGLQKLAYISALKYMGYELEYQVLTGQDYE